MPAEVRAFADPHELGENLADDLADRALWRGVLGADDPALLLRLHSAPRLQRLGEIVDRHGRPWSR